MSKNDKSKEQKASSKTIVDHLHDLLQAAEEHPGLKGKNIAKVVLTKPSTLDPAIKKFNKALKTDPHLKDFAFQAFQADDGSHLHINGKVCCVRDKGCGQFPECQ